MKKLSIVFLVLVVLLIVAVKAGLPQYLGIGVGERLKPGQVVETDTADQQNKQPIDTSSTLVNEAPSGSQTRSAEYSVESVATGLNVPWDFEFLPDGRIWLTERPGQIRQIVNNTLQPQPIFTAPDISPNSEAGLMGIAIDPDFSSNRRTYVCWVYKQDGNLKNKVVRLIENGTQLKLDKVLLDNIPSAANHAGCQLEVGPDKLLYITTGDATDETLAQNKNSLAGKILRMTLGGDVPSDNPYQNLVYSYGHRNSQGIAWHPEHQYLISTEHGPSVFDGPAGGDEVNWIQPGHNYGWPQVSHTATAAGMDNPLLVFTPAEAPASATFYTGDAFPEFRNNMFFGALKGEGIVRVVFADQQQPQVIYFEKLSGIDVGRIRTVKSSPDGLLYFVTSNRDGRGKAGNQDDQLYKLVRK